VKFRRNTLKACDEVIFRAMIIPLHALSLNMPHKLKLTAQAYIWHTKRPQTLIIVTKNAF
jgi:hypothetical protein